MKNITRRAFLSLVVGAIVTAATPEPAEAMPAKFRKCPQVEQNGVRYLLWKRCAIVTKTPNRASVTIPHTIKHDGQTYLVRSIWDHTVEMCPKTRRVILKARSLEAIEDPAIFEDHSIKVVAYDRSTYAWLKRSGVNVRKHF